MSIYVCVIIISSLFLGTTFAQQSEFDAITVLVWVNGDVQVGVDCYVVELPFQLPYFPSIMGSNYLWLQYYVDDDKLNCFLRLNLDSRSEAEVDDYAYKVKEILENWFGMKFEFSARIPRSFSTPRGLIRWIDYNFTASGFNPDVILDKFLALKPEEGWMVLINRQVLSSGDKVWLWVYPGIRFGRLYFSKKFRNVFNFKVGNTYTLDIFKLFNFTSSIEIKRKSEVEITLLYYGHGPNKIYSNLQAELVDVELPFEYKVGVALHEENPPGVNIGTFGELTGNVVVDYMRITFKIVEYGFKPPSSSLYIIIGWLIVIIVVTCIISLILVKQKRK